MEKITYRKTLDVHKNGIQFLLQGFETADKMSRVVEISLMASGDAIDFPGERMVALMYVTSPGATEPSIYECRLVDNKIVYEVLPITTEGITEMQIKIIENDISGAKSVLASPKFAIEVGKSNTEDEEVEKKPEFTALEEASARAKLVYDERFVRMEITEDGTFIAYYADGTTYESKVIAEMLVSASTELDLASLVKNGLTSFTADEVAAELKDDLDAEYRDFFATAVYSANLMGIYPEARFVYWDEKTVATPLKALLTDKTKGFALVMGDGNYNHTVLAWCVGEKTRTFYSRFIVSGYDFGWKDGNKEITSIVNGGTGAGTEEEARKNLGVPSKEELEKVRTQHDWNLERNISKINTKSLTIMTDKNDDIEYSKSVDVIMINSGKVCIEFNEFVNPNGTKSPFDSAEFTINNGEKVVYSNIVEGGGSDYSKDVKLILDVKKGDIINFSYSVITRWNDTSCGIAHINLYANIETAYKYNELSNLVDSDFTLDDAIDTIKGE